jgi:hypothetical protein
VAYSEMEGGRDFLFRTKLIYVQAKTAITYVTECSPIKADAIFETWNCKLSGAGSFMVRW